MTEQKTCRDKELFNYTFGKEFDRFFRKQIVKEAKKTSKAAAHLNLSVSLHSKEIEDAFKKSENQ